ncbi:MAG: hypothetical protein EOO26_05905 [Comamonadaceae bacterium]|nr:MAG: hypothetical protein EOO26_05905 [Comamonadaceae bacterium]
MNIKPTDALRHITLAAAAASILTFGSAASAALTPPTVLASPPAASVATQAPASSTVAWATSCDDPWYWMSGLEMATCIASGQW